MDYKQFRELVQQMRNLQKEYFRTRDHSTLYECKKIERLIDDYLSSIETAIKREVDSQSKLF